MFPFARQTAIEQLHAGMLVLDPEGNIVSLNPAARAILGMTEKQLIGLAIRDLLPACTEDLLASRMGQVEMSLGTGLERRDYHLEASALNDWHGMEVGRLLMLRDVTTQKQVQAQILEQQRTLAMVYERE